MKKQSKTLLLGILAGTLISLSVQADNSFNAGFPDTAWDGINVPPGSSVRSLVVNHQPCTLGQWHPEWREPAGYGI